MHATGVYKLKWLPVAIPAAVISASALLIAIATGDMYAIVVIVLLCGWPHSTQCSEPMTAEDIQNLEDVIPGEYIILLSTESNAPINEQMSKMKEFADGHGLRSVTFSGHAEIGSVKAVRASGSHFEMEVLRQHENVKKISRNNIVRALHQPLAMTKEDTEICTQQQTGMHWLS